MKQANLRAAQQEEKERQPKQAKTSIKGKERA
jgi:hypothetical protein